MQHWTFGLKKAGAKQDFGLNPLCLGMCTERNKKVSKQGKKENMQKYVMAINEHRVTVSKYEG